MGDNTTTESTNKNSSAEDATGPMADNLYQKPLEEDEPLSPSEETWWIQELSKDGKLLHCNKKDSHLKPPGQELVLDLQEVAPVHFTFERLIENGVTRIILDVLPASITVAENWSGSEEITVEMNNSATVLLSTFILESEKESNPAPKYSTTTVFFT